MRVGHPRMINVEQTAIDDRCIRSAVRGSGGRIAGLAVVWVAALALVPGDQVRVTHELREVRRTVPQETLSGRLRRKFSSPASI